MGKPFVSSEVEAPALFTTSLDSARDERRKGNVLRPLTLGCTGLILLLACAHPAHAGLFGQTRKEKAAVYEEYKPTIAPPLPPSASNGAIFQSTSGYAALVEGQRARRIGDMLTIELVEKTAATKESSSNLSRNGSIGIQPPTTGPLSFFKASDASIGDTSGFKGSGTADQSNALTGEVSVTIAEVYPNGTMLVRGQKTVTLNRGDEFIQISGIVRQADINPDNQVLSTRVADAKIRYTGSGDVARTARQGWLGRFFNAVSPL